MVLILPHLRYSDITVGLLALAAGLYLALDLLFPLVEVPERDSTGRLAFLARLSLVTIIICVAALGPVTQNILLRLTAAPESDAYVIAYSKMHDGAIQTEQAISFLLQGKNPYAEDYDKTLVARYFLPGLPLNPAIYHYAYLPFTFLFSLPFYEGFTSIVGWYDQRVVYALAFLLVLLILPQLAKSADRKLSLLAVVGLNYLLVDSLAIGMNDILVLASLLVTTYLFQKGHRLASTIPLGLACATKQMAWFFLPFYFLLQFNGSPSLREMGSLIKKTYPFFLTFALLVLPFFLWNPAAFIDDTFSYLSGISPTSYPIRGFGLGALLLACGVIKSNTAYFPFWILQLIFGLPLLIYLLKKQRRENNLQRCWLNYGIFLTIMAFLSRFFQTNYLGYAIAVFSIAFFVDTPAITTPTGVGKGTPI
jgi:uncharacterized membrane protein